MKSVIKGAGYILVHTPDMVIHNGTTQTTERIVNPEANTSRSCPATSAALRSACLLCPTRSTSAT